MIIKTRQLQNILRKEIHCYDEYIKHHQVRIALSGIISLTHCTTLFAFTQAANIIANALKIATDVFIPRKLAFQHISHAKRIQRKWKSIICLNNFRKLLLRNKWKIVINKLIRKNLDKGGESSLLAKLQGITMNSCNRVLDAYYNIRKNDYRTKLRMFNVLLIFMLNREGKRKYVQGLTIYLITNSWLK